MRLWPWGGGKSELQQIAKVREPAERIRAYSTAVERHLRFPKHGATSWKDDATHVRAAVALLEQMGNDGQLPAQSQLDALTAYKHLSRGTDSALKRAEAHRDASAFIADVNATADLVASWNDVSLDSRIAALQVAAAREQAAIAEATRLIG